MFTLGFAPDPVRAAAMADEVSRRLQDSLAYVLPEIAKPLEIDRADIDPWLAKAAGVARLPPVVHALFHDVVQAVQAGDAERARRAAFVLLVADPRKPPLEVANLCDDDLGLGAALAVAKHVELEEENALDLIAPEPALAAASAAVLASSRALIGQVDHAFDAELRELVQQYVLAVQGPHARFVFGGVAAFEVWGALVLAADDVYERADSCLRLAHESAHALLFGMALDGPLLTNPPEARYRSPLRDDPRPMGGIFHATYVSARMTRLARLLLASDALTTPERELLERRARDYLDAFHEGTGVIGEHGLLTPTGRGLLDSAGAALAG